MRRPWLLKLAHCFPSPVERRVEKQEVVMKLNMQHFAPLLLGTAVSGLVVLSLAGVRHSQDTFVRSS
jgi:hypothetical protein